MDYQFTSIIGHGTYGVVYKATHIPTGENFAIKKLYKKFKTIDECMQQKKQHVYLVFEYMEQNLYQYYSMFKKQNKLMNENLIAKIIQQLLEGVQFMHEKGYFHRDLKPENILVSQDIVKICDFGSIKPIDCLPPYTEYTSTRWYRSPEQIADLGFYNYPVDIFAIGAIMAELYTLRPLFQGKNQNDQYLQICKVLGQPPNQNFKTKEPIFNHPISLENIMSCACPEAQDLMEKMFHFNPEKRPQAKELLQHEYFQKFNKYEVKQKKSSFRITTINQKIQPCIDDYTEEQKKLLSLSLEPKHKQLILLKNYKENQKKNIFQKDFINNQLVPPPQNIYIENQKYQGRVFKLNKNKQNYQKISFPKILIQKNQFYKD